MTAPSQTRTAETSRKPSGACPLSMRLRQGFSMALAFVLAFTLAFPIGALAAEDEGVAPLPEEDSSTELVETLPISSAQVDEAEEGIVSEGRDDEGSDAVFEEAAPSGSGEDDESFDLSAPGQDDVVLSAASLQERVTGFKYSQSTTGSGLNLTVSWNEIKGGVPTVFHCEGAGVADSYLYMLNGVFLKNEDTGAWELVTDPSRHMKYGPEEDIPFTFTVSGNYWLRFHVMTENVRPVQTKRIDLYFSVNDPAYPSCEQIAAQVVAECRDAGKTSDYDKALWLHDWILDHIVYDNSLVYCGAEGALARGTGTCESYHRAYTKLLERAGLQTGRIEGNGHVWTAVKIDGAWCQIDATWDDGGHAYQFLTDEDMRHFYFGLDDAITGLVHSDHKAPVPGCESSTLANNYFVRNGKSAVWAQGYIADIADRLARGERVFSVPVTNDFWPPNYKNVVNNLILYELNRYDWGSVPTVGSDFVQITLSNDAFQVQEGWRIVNPPKAVSPVYNGKQQTGVAAGVGYTVQGGSATKVGTYTATVTPAAGYAWNTAGDRAPRKITWKILAAPSVAYTTHVQNIGWQAEVRDGARGGTSGRALRVEAFKVRLVNQPYGGGIRVRSHVQNIGWQGWAANGALSGTSGRGLRVEALQIELTGEMARYYDVYYRTHVQNVGDTGWAKNGQSCGSAGYAYRMEAVYIKLVPKGAAAPGSTAKCFVHPLVTYQTHVQNIGWQKAVSDGATGGTSGRGLRVEAFKVKLDNPDYSGDIQVSSHVQNIGWQGWVSNGALSGTSGRALRVEALKIRLTGEMANRYDVYYRTHVQNIGWTGWAKNGTASGSAGYAYRMEAVQIKLVTKGGKAPGPTANSFYQKK